MNQVLRRILLPVAIAAASCFAPLPAGAGPLADAEAQQIREVIATQLSAFALDDADKAFATATPAVREAIGNSGRFLAMVRGAYPMVYRAGSVSFLKPEADDGTVLQLVQITDADDKTWLALFALERQPDNSWRISGCAVAENRWRSA